MSEEIHNGLLGDVIGAAHGVSAGLRKSVLAGVVKHLKTAAQGVGTVRQLSKQVRTAPAATGPAAPAANTPQLSKSSTRTAQQEQQTTPAAASQPPPAPRHTPVVGQPLSPRQENRRQKWLDAGKGA
ncbi:hypothetical protein GCM10023205_39070 [Yinghuangia aomiensis]|uniref:Uncharacterized protein n=1 Tax=Yinghuangia aomiensis TaxID=676205 RepID=A0ABP9HFL1_9ACTN